MLRRINRLEAKLSLAATVKDALALIVLVALALLLLAGCAGPRPRCDFESRGACVSVERLTDADRALLTASAVDEAIDLGLSFWEADASVLDGWTLAFHDAPIAECNGAGGCVRVRTHEIDVFVRASFAAPRCARELTAALPHEIGHVVLNGDPQHTDPRWMKLGPAVSPFLRCEAP